VSSTRIFIEAPHQFHEADRAVKGDLKKRAMRLLASKCRDEGFATLQEVSDPGIADACFRILMTDGQWKIGKRRL